MAYKFNPFTGNFDDFNGPNGEFTSIDVDGDITLDDGGTYTTTLQTITPTAARTISFPDATGTVGLVGGSSGNLVVNQSGAYAGVANSSVDNATGNITLGSRFISSLNGAASAPPGTFTGTWFTGGTATTTKPQVLIEPTSATSTAWSTSGTGLGVNAASGFAGRLLDLQLNGTSKFSVTSAGAVSATGSVTASALDASTGQCIAGNGAGRLTGAGFSTTSGGVVRWSSGTDSNSGPFDVIILRDAANTLAQRNGTNAQTYRLYNTFTDASNYERGFLRWSSNVFEVGPEAAGTGTARPMRITAATLKLPNLPTYADNAAALAGSLVAGDVYKTATGELRITV